MLKRLLGSKWKKDLLFALPIVGLVVYLFYSWFGVHDRYLIFLYFHDMGPGFDTSPFGWVTASRYWMAGLVASGAVMVLYIGVNLILGQVVRGFQVVGWGRLWALCAVPLAIIVPVIVMTVNDPVLPPANAVQVAVVTLVGLALAVILGKLAAERLLKYLFLMVDGFGLVFCSFLSPALKIIPAGWQGGTRE